MSLLKENEEMKAQLAEALEAEESAETENEEEGQLKEDSEQSETPETTEEATEEKPSEEVKEEKPDNAAFAKIRREAAAAKLLVDKLERENAELKKPREQEIEQESPVAAELEQVIQESRKGRAENEFRRYESEVIKAAPENAAIMTEYTQAIQGSIRLNNPRLSIYEIAELTKLSLLQKAGKYQNEGYANPVEEMLHEAKELGFTGKSFTKEEKSEAGLKPNMTKVAENRKRSAGMTAISGTNDGIMSLKAAAELSPMDWKDFGKKSPAEKARLLGLIQTT